MGHDEESISDVSPSLVSYFLLPFQPLNRLAFQSRNEKMENASSEANNAARYLSLDDFRVFAAELESSIIATQVSVKAAQICNSDRAMKCDSRMRKKIMFYLL